MTRRFLLPLMMGFLSLATSGCRADTSATGSGGKARKPAEPVTPFVITVPEGKVIVGYIQDDADPSKCATIIDLPEGVPVFQRAGDQLAQVMKGHVVPSCPAENAVGECDDSLGFYQSYYAPKWSKAKGRRDCAKRKRHWAE